MTPLRCPLDTKFFFEYADDEPFAGRLRIKCRGCGHLWLIRGVAGNLVIEIDTEEEKSSTTP